MNDGRGTILRLSVFATHCILATAAAQGMAGTAFAANGCADGTFSQTQSPDGNASSVLFDDFSASGGGGSGAVRGRTDCKLRVPVTQPKGYSVYNVDYRGFVATENGQTASIVASKDGRTILDHQITGPLQDDVAANGRIGVSGSDTLDINVTLQAGGPLDPALPEAGLFLDSIDFARIGFTTTQSVQASANQIARQQQSIVMDLTGTAQDMLGQTERFDRGNYIAAFGTTDASAGFNARWEAGDGVTLLGGAAFVSPSRTDVDIDNLALLAAGIRYTTPQAPWRAFGEAGGWGSPKVTARFSRSYLNLGDAVVAGGTDTGSLFSTYGRIGAIYAPDDANEFALSLRYTRAWLDMDGYSETATDRNLFAATTSGRRSATDTVAAEFAWSHETAGPLDYTLSAAVGRTFGTSDAVRMSVDFVGDVDGRSADTNFAAIGGRVGWQLTDQWKLNGTTSVNFRENNDARFDIGASLQSKF